MDDITRDDKLLLLTLIALRARLGDGGYEEAARHLLAGDELVEAKPANAGPGDDWETNGRLYWIDPADGRTKRKKKDSTPDASRRRRKAADAQAPPAAAAAIRSLLDGEPAGMADALEALRAVKGREQLRALARELGLSSRDKTAAGLAARMADEIAARVRARLAVEPRRLAPGDRPAWRDIRPHFRSPSEWLDAVHPGAAGDYSRERLRRTPYYRSLVADWEAQTRGPGDDSVRREREAADAAEAARLKQADPSHPVARAIRADRAAAELAESIRAALGETAGELREAEADYGRASRASIAFTLHKEPADFWTAPAAKYPELWAEHRRIGEAVAEARSRRDEVRAKRLAALVRTLRASNPAPARFNPSYGAPGWVSRLMAGATPLDDGGRSAAEAAAEFVSAAASMSEPLDVQFVDSPRAFANPGVFGAAVVGLNFDDPSSGVHELAHIVELKKPGALARVREFIEYRFGDEPEVDFAELGYDEMKGERGRKDDFDRAFDGVEAYYVGKTYGLDLPWPLSLLHGGEKSVAASEILAMGLQKLYDDPEELLDNDPEYARFLLSVLRS